MTANKIVISEEETENSCNRFIFEEIYSIVDYKARFNLKENIVLINNKLKNKSYNAVYLTVFSPPPDFLSII